MARATAAVWRHSSMYLSRSKVPVRSPSASSLPTSPTSSTMDRFCKQHGTTKHYKRKDGGWRCRTCETERIARHRRATKERLVKEHGGKCEVCGYDRYIGALHFHHRDPDKKLFEISNRSRSWTAMQDETQKCVLLCSNCHIEVEAGLAIIP